MKTVISLFLTLCILGCGAQRASVPVGTIPYQDAIPSQEEQYGQQVFSMLSEQYPLSQNDQHILKAREIVERLTSLHSNPNNPWHVHVFEDHTVKNAAATRGNFIFVWSGLLDFTSSDGELATVLSHEIGHVLAGHTLPTPQEEFQQILSQTSGRVVQEIVYQTGGTASAFAGLAGVLLSSLLEAALLNPERKRKELEADHIGLFLMAEAGFDPALALEFWRKVQHDPSFRSFLEGGFLSTHPASEQRLEELEFLLPQAQERLRESSSSSKSTSTSTKQDTSITKSRENFTFPD